MRKRRKGWLAAWIAALLLFFTACSGRGASDAAGTEPDGSAMIEAETAASYADPDRTPVNSSEPHSDGGESLSKSSEPRSDSGESPSKSSEPHSDSSEPPSQNRESSSADDFETSPQPLELVDFGWYVKPSDDDTAYVNFCGVIHNPNQEQIARFPRLMVTVRDGDGNISATEEQVGSDVMPEDTITLCGMLTMPAADVTKEAEITFDIDLSEWDPATLTSLGAKTTDFEIKNVSKKSTGMESTVTGEIVNHYTEEIGLVNISVVFRKDGEIVYMKNTFLDNLKAGKAKAFEIGLYDPWPEHDTLEVSAMVW